MAGPDDEPVSLRVENFGEQNRRMLAELFVNPARAVLARHHASPAVFTLTCGGSVRAGRVEFDQPDERTVDSLERRRLTEHAAIVFAGLMLPYFEGLQITRVIQIGDHVDYFAGTSPNDESFVLEVGGTENGSLAWLRTEKLRQARDSRYRKAPFDKTAFISVTRFAPAAESLLERVVGEKEEA